MKKFMRSLLCSTVFLAISATAFADNHMMVRMRSITIMPEESGTPSVIKGDAKVSDATVPELDFSYFFNESFSLYVSR